jgi:hypothetical protein
MSAFSLPLSEFDVRNSRFAAEPAGNVNSPIPARVVTARSVRAPESRVTVYRPGVAVSLECENVPTYLASLVSAVGEESTVPTYGRIGTSPAAPGAQPAPLTWVRLKPRRRVVL